MYEEVFFQNQKKKKIGQKKNGSIFSQWRFNFVQIIIFRGRVGYNRGNQIITSDYKDKNSFEIFF